MKRVLSTIVLATSLSAPAWAETNIGISVNIGDAPPPPVVVVRSEPRLVYVSDARCWVVADERWSDDCFKHGRYWYTWHDGWWYRAKSWRGPYRVIETRYVPVAVHRVPARHWKHHPQFGHAYPSRHPGRVQHHHPNNDHYADDQYRRRDRDRDQRANVVVKERRHRRN